MRKFAFEFIVILMFTAVMLLQLHLINIEKNRETINYEAQIIELTSKLDSLTIQENYYESKIINNRTIYNSYRDSILNLPDSALSQQVYGIVNRYFYLHENPAKNDSINGQ